MGFISEEERKDLDLLREVRNAFAHAWRPITFTNELIIGHIASLKCAMGHSPDDLMPRSPLTAAFAGSQDPNRLKFIEGCRKMSLAILNSADTRRSRLPLR
jgi:DNA-binding MltR family transcriptional regulator